MDYDLLPCVSICMPTWNRNKFKPLILQNIMGINYPHDKLEFVIDDDGDEKFIKNKMEFDFIQNVIKPIKLNYNYYNNRRSIGAKRNNLTKLASHKYIACMDSDDIYIPDYVLYGICELLKGNYGCVGSNQMLFVYPYDNFKTHAIRCSAKRQIHEATMIYTKKHHRSMGGFVSRGKQGSQGEGCKMADFNEKNVGLLDIDKCMCCVVHNGNTICKEMFKKDDNVIETTIHPQVKWTLCGCLGIN